MKKNTIFFFFLIFLAYKAFPATPGHISCSKIPASWPGQKTTRTGKREVKTTGAAVYSKRSNPNLTPLPLESAI